MCGASEKQNAAFGNEVSVSDTLTSALKQVFGENTNIIDSIKSAMEPIVAAGANAFGFSAPEEAARRTEATDRLASAGAQESNAVRGAMASRGGGNTYLPSGSEASINAGIAEDTAQKEASAQLGITKEGYDVGRENFFRATSGLAGTTAELENPIGSLGNSAVNAAGQQMTGANEITAANNAWIAPVAGAIGAFAGGPAAAKIASNIGSTVATGLGGGCWIITAIYGKDTFNTRALWAWMTNEKHGWNRRSKIGEYAVKLYYKYGERAAELVKTNRAVRFIFKTIFDWLLEHKVREAAWIYA